MAYAAFHHTPYPHATQPLKEIIKDHTPEACSHCTASDTITITYYDHRGGSRWRTATRFSYGTFSVQIKFPSDDTSGLNFKLYLCSMEGDMCRDEIDFEFLGKDKTSVQTNYYCNGRGNNERIHVLGFNASEEFHEYVIKWGEDMIEWCVDGKTVRREERHDGWFPKKDMFLYASIWNAGWVDGGRWCGKYVGSDEPYVCVYKDVHVPVGSAVE